MLYWEFEQTETSNNLGLRTFKVQSNSSNLLNLFIYDSNITRTRRTIQ